MQINAVNGKLSVNISLTEVVENGIASQTLQPIYVGIINKGNTALFILAAVYAYKLLDKKEAMSV